MDKFSIIIPTYNEQQQIAPTIERLLKISTVLVDYAFEIIVVDGNSSDDTAAIAGSYSQVKLVQSVPGRGLQLALGAEQASGDMLVFLHADTVVKEDYFCQVAAALSADAGWGCAHLSFHDQAGKQERGIFSLISFFSNLRIRRSAIAYGDQSIFCARDFYRQHGGYNKELIFFEDYHFSERARQLAKPSFIAATSSTSSRRHRNNGIWRTIWRMQATRWRYMSGQPIKQLWEYYNR